MYLGMIAAIVTAVGVFQNDMPLLYPAVLIFLISTIWFLTIKYFRRLAKAKFAVVSEIEKDIYSEEELNERSMDIDYREFLRCVNNAFGNNPYITDLLTLYEQYPMKEEFLLDMHRGSINLKKVTYQERVRKSIVLLRLDLGTAPHRNPNGEEIPPLHLHRYREGFGDKWAFPLPRDCFEDLNDLYQILKDFMKFCNIVKPPVIRRRIFS